VHSKYPWEDSEEDKNGRVESLEVFWFKKVLACDSIRNQMLTVLLFNFGYSVNEVELMFTGGERRIV
jgi:hypothetical protein